jgi:Na+/melibiose symporter-like transporter
MTSPLRTSAAVAYALPALPLAALYFPVYVYIAPFYGREFGVALGALGTLFIAVRLMDAFTDPLMGWISDRTPPRLGRRRIWLLVSVPLVTVSVWMLMVPPEGAGFAHVAIWMTALTLSWTVALTPWYAWGAEMTGEYAGRARVTAWREGIGLGGTVLAVILYNTADGPAAGMRAVALLVAIALPVTAALALLGAPEPRDFSKTRLSLGAAAAALRDNAPFRRLLIAYFVNGSANALPAGLFLFFIEDYLQAPDAGWLLLVYFVCAIAGMPLWAWLARRYPKHRVWGGAMLYACAVFICVPLLGPGDVTGFTVICVLTGLALSADLALPPAIQADVVDVDTAAHGEQRTGLYFALWSVATKAALAVAGGAALIVLDGAGFVAGEENDAAALTTLVVLYAVAPVVLKALAVALMWGFPLDEAEHDRLRAAIEAG